MKVLHIIPSISPLRGGPSTAVLDMCSILAKNGVDVLLLTTDDDGPSTSGVQTNTPIMVDGYPRLYFQREARPYTISTSLLRWLRRNACNYDLVHVHAVFSHSSDWAPVICRSQQIPYGVTTHGLLGKWGLRHRRPIIKRLFIKVVVKPNLQHARFVHFTSTIERNEASAFYASSNAATFPLGLSFQDSPLIARKPVLDGVLRVLHLSRIDKKKGLGLLLHALALQPDPACVQLSIAGAGESSYMQELKSLCEDLGISRQVSWLGAVTGADKQRAFADADLFVSPSYSESLGIAPVEAMASGLPVIISDQMGISNEVAAAGAGLVVPPNSRQLANALHVLNSNRHLLPLMGERAHTLAIEKYSLDKLSHNLISLYSDAMCSTIRAQPV